MANKSQMRRSENLSLTETHSITPLMNTLLNRRHFLRLAALAPLGAGTPSHALTAIPRTGGASFRPGLNAYSFLEQLNANMADPTKGMDLFGVCDFCAQHDIEAVDLTGYFFPGYPKAPADSFTNRMKRYTHDRGITNSGTGVKNDFATADKAVRAEGVELTKVWTKSPRGSVRQGNTFRSPFS